jgi:hypothetical protein
MKGITTTEYVLEGELKLVYIGILFFSCLILYLIADIKFKLFRFDMLQGILGWTDNQMKLFSAVLIIMGVWGITFIYSGFFSVKIDSNEITLKYFKPRPPVIISKESLGHYEVSISQHEDTKGNQGLVIYLKNGRKYKSAGIDVKRKDILDQLTKQLDIVIKEHKEVPGTLISPAVHKK